MSISFVRILAAVESSVVVAEITVAHIPTLIVKFLQPSLVMSDCLLRLGLAVALPSLVLAKKVWTVSVFVVAV